MKPETVSLLCSPGTHEPLSLSSVPDSAGNATQMLFGVHSGEIFYVHDGIPLLLDELQVYGANRHYQRLYDRVAGLYDAAIKLFATLVGGGEAHFRRQYLQELELQDGCRVLEVSIGTGANLRYLPPQAAYYGLDISWRMLKRCQQNLKRWGRAAELILGNAEELPLIDEAFDAVFHVGGINAFNDRLKALCEMIRVARSGVKIMVVDETARLMQPFAWIPGVRSWLEQYGERLSAPVDLLPPGMRDVQVKQIAKGNLYCLTFRKP